MQYTVTTLSKLSGVSPRTLRFYDEIRWMPWLAIIMMKLCMFMSDKPSLFNQMVKQLPEADKEIFRDPNKKSNSMTAIREAFRQGVTGVSQEIVLSVKPWGFHLEDIDCPMTIWQGGQDKQAPEMHGKIFSDRIPNARLMFFKEEGHLSILTNHGEEILRSIYV